MIPKASPVPVRVTLSLGTFIALLFFGTFAGSAEAAITIAWDANPEAEVAGYRVFIGTNPGVYSETIDVGVHQLSFVYTNGRPGVRYYFSVAAIAAGGAGPKSPEVSAVEAGSESGLPLTGTLAAASLASRAFGSGEVEGRSADRATSHVACVARSAECYSVAVLAEGLSAVTALALTPNGDLLIVEDQTRVRRLTASASSLDVALESSLRIGAIAVDPAFAENGFVYTTESATRLDGSAVVSVVRYRSLDGRFGEAATLATGFQVAEGSAAPLAIDRGRTLYLALPAHSDRRDPYEAHVLTFGSDGTPSTSGRSGSPQFAHGFALPTGVHVSAANQLWLTGSRDGWPVTVATVNLGAPAAVAPRIPTGVMSPVEVTAIATSDDGEAITFLITRSAELFRATIGPDGLAGLVAVPIGDFGEPVTMASGTDGLYVAIRQPAPAIPGHSSFAILKVTSRPR
jgi:hypothetical protein